jgi:hypothetical protein
LENLLTPDDYQKVNDFTRYGMDVKILSDDYSYKEYISKSGEEFLQNPRILDVYVEKPKDEVVVS